MHQSNAYLVDILNKYQAKDLHKYWKKLQGLKNVLLQWSGACYLNIYDYGARAKGTSTSLHQDVDYLLSISENCSSRNPSFKGCYSTLQEQLELLYTTQQKSNAIIVNIDDLNVNITRAHADLNNTDLHDLYMPQTKNWQKTNIHQHINDVLMSNCTNEIKVIKIWRDLHSLDMPSIYLEYLIIQKLLLNKSKSPDRLAENVQHILAQLAKDPTSNPLYSRIVDPANKQNIFSNLIGENEKHRIVQQAKSTIAAANIEKMVW